MTPTDMRLALKKLDGTAELKPSELILLALADLASVEADDRYVVDMCSLHEPRRQVCHVCFAGAFIAGTMGIGPDRGMYDLDFVSEPWRSRLSALQYLRTGGTNYALEQLTGVRDTRFDRRMVYYEEDGDPAPFHEHMRLLAMDLEAEGL